MLTLDNLCNLAAGSTMTSAPLRQACALPRSVADKRPLPVPGAEFAFDSSWEALYTGTDVAGEPEPLDQAL